MSIFIRTTSVSTSIETTIVAINDCFYWRHDDGIRFDFDGMVVMQQMTHKKLSKLQPIHQEKLLMVIKKLLGDTCHNVKVVVDCRTTYATPVHVGNQRKFSKSMTKKMSRAENEQADQKEDENEDGLNSESDSNRSVWSEIVYTIILQMNLI